MIVSKESIRDVAELATHHIMSTTACGAGKSSFEAVDYNFEVDFDITVDMKRNSAHIKVFHKGVDLGTIQMSDMDIMTSNVWSNEKKLRWVTKTTEYLTRQLSKYLIKKFISEDSAMVDVRKRLEASGDTVKWSVGPLSFSACYSQIWQSIRCKQEGAGVLYENVKTNVIGVTTEQGYQALNINNILGDTARVLAAAISQEAVEFTVEV